jgi:hypothetical protein
MWPFRAEPNVVDAPSRRQSAQPLVNEVRSSVAELRPVAAPTDERNRFILEVATISDGGPGSLLSRPDRKTGRPASEP